MLALDLILMQVDVHHPVHAFNRPVPAYELAQQRVVVAEACDIQPLFRSLPAGGFLYRFRDIFYDGQVASPFLFVDNQVRTAVNDLGSRFYPAVAELRSIGIPVEGFCRIEPVLHSVAEAALVGLQLYEEVTSLLLDFVDDVLLH